MAQRPLTLQEFPLDAGIKAVKDSLRFAEFAAFQAYLNDSLPQNSPETRSRFSQLIIRWFFRDHQIDGLLPQVWRAYQDEQILLELMRVTTLEYEPVIAQFVTKVVLAMVPGSILLPGTTRDFIIATYGTFKEPSYRRLLKTARHLGFLERRDGQWAVASIRRPADALLLLLHARLAPTPRIVTIADLLAAPFWRFLGFRDPDEVRRVMTEAETASLVARYSIVDQLEQVTTRYGWTAYLANRCLLQPEEARS